MPPYPTSAPPAPRFLRKFSFSRRLHVITHSKMSSAENEISKLHKSLYLTLVKLTRARVQCTSLSLGEVKSRVQTVKYSRWGVRTGGSTATLMTITTRDFTLAPFSPRTRLSEGARHNLKRKFRSYLFFINQPARGSYWSY